MAYFEGTQEEFYTFLGPRTSDLVYKISKPFRKQQKSCLDKDENSKVCGKWKNLDAAHLAHRTRIIIINEILEEFGEKNTKLNTYKISIEDFEKEFHNKHKDFFNTIQFRCRRHHRAYDKKYKVVDLKDNVMVDNEKDYEPNFDLDYHTKSNIIKSYLLSKVTTLKKDICSIAKNSGNKWNFNINVKDLNKEFYLICYNQNDFTAVVLKINKNSLTINSKKSNKDLVSINIPYSETEFIEKKTGYKFEIIELIKLKP